MTQQRCIGNRTASVVGFLQREHQQRNEKWHCVIGEATSRFYIIGGLEQPEKNAHRAHTNLRFYEREFVHTRFLSSYSSSSSSSACKVEYNRQYTCYIRRKLGLRLEPIIQTSPGKKGLCLELLIKPNQKKRAPNYRANTHMKAVFCDMKAVFREYHKVHHSSYPV